MNYLYFVGITCCVCSLLSMVLFSFGVHHIEEGNVGIYYRGGNLMTTIAKPGYHFMIPFLTSTKTIQVSFKTSSVENIPCGTSSGVMLYFSRIEVVHQLQLNQVIGTVQNYSMEYDKIWIHDRLHHEINQICSKSTLHEVYISKFDQFDDIIIGRMNHILSLWALGIQIISVRLTKPRIPQILRKSYEEIDTIKTQFLVVQQRHQTILREAETIKRAAVLDAEKNFSISRINSKKMETKALRQLEISAIEDTMIVNRIRQNADAWFYHALQDSESMKQKLTPQYLSYLKAKYKFQNMEIHYGNAIPKALVITKRGSISL